MFYFHPYLGKWSNLTNIFQRGWNHQLVEKGQLPHFVTTNVGRPKKDRLRGIFWKFKTTLINRLQTSLGAGELKLTRDKEGGQEFDTWLHMFPQCEKSFILSFTCVGHSFMAKFCPFIFIRCLPLQSTLSPGIILQIRPPPKKKINMAISDCFLCILHGIADFSDALVMTWYVFDCLGKHYPDRVTLTFVRKITMGLQKISRSFCFKSRKPPAAAATGIKNHRNGWLPFL